MRMPINLYNNNESESLLLLELKLDDILTLQEFAKAAELYFQNLTKREDLSVDERKEAAHNQLIANKWWTYTFNLEKTWGTIQPGYNKLGEDNNEFY